MGNCVSDEKSPSSRNNQHNTKHGTTQDNNVGDRDKKKRIIKGRPITENYANNKGSARFISSIIRVGSRVFKPGDFDDVHAEGLREVKASTYDHVHEIVNMGIESYPHRRRGSGTVGLTNMGNTCFMNSSLQCLSNTIPLTDYFLGYDYRSEINHDNFLGTKGELVTSYAELIKHLWLGSSPSFKPLDFKIKLERFAPQFEGYEQQDAQELLAFLLDGIHEDLNRVRKRPYIEDKDGDGSNDEGDAIVAWSNYLERNRSIIVDLFQGQLRNTMVCRNRNVVRQRQKGKDHEPKSAIYGCGHKNVKFDPFMYLSLPISDTSDTLDDCLSLFCEEELLTGDEKWYCPNCKQHVDATKKIDLWMLPPILIIHLKRFKFFNASTNSNDRRMTQRRSKIDRSISYPLEDWDLTSMKKSEGGCYPLYDLYAVSHHRGNVGFGHYTAHAKNRFDGLWYDFNDSQCNVIQDPTKVLGSGPSSYCLFYNRVEKVATQNGGSGNGCVGTSGGRDDVEVFSKRTNPVIRRQSTSRPELWPHLQDRGRVSEWKSMRISEQDRRKMLDGVLDDEGKDEAEDMTPRGKRMTI